MTSQNLNESNHLSLKGELFHQVLQMREDFYNDHIGPLPDDIRKIGHLFGVWPAGGLYVIPATHLGENLWVYATSGLTNADMPTSVKIKEGSYQQVRDEFGRIVKEHSELEYKQPVVMPPNTAGYGYELLILTTQPVEWPLWVLQWAVGAELIHDIDMMDRVSNNHGLTIDQVKIDYDKYANLFINKAEAPLPTDLFLPNGNMRFLVITLISDAEMGFTFEHGRRALLERLKAQSHAGNWQIADLNRPSVI